MSPVEQFWQAIRAKWTAELPEWQNLGQNQQLMLIQGLNILITVCKSVEGKEK